uniref:Putative DNA binding protein TutB1 n=1 Tax=Thauera aromatica TaxID=59405 RepID=Q9ZB24_THAAR|nr:putative DNA binding protein TutB1 [Thauera aromatica]
MQIEKSGNAPTVFVVDDEASVRDSLTWLLNSISLNVKAYESAKHFLDADISCTYGCVILDVRMQNVSGLQLQQALCDRGFKLPIIFLSAYGDAQMGAQAVKKGAFDFLQKPYRNQDLLDAVNAALAFSKEMTNKQREKQERADLLAALSQREMEILDKVVCGNSSKEIAKLLGISHKTVEAHRGRIMSKLGLRSTGDLIHFAMRSSSHCSACEWLSLPGLQQQSTDH